MKEKAVRIGKNAMVGVLTDPDPEVKLADAPAVIFLNAGLLHKVGACRLHVEVARMLAPTGFTSLRFDFSGMGDSEPRKDGLSFEQAAVREVQESMDYLEKARGVRSFVLIGLCSGADMAYETACTDTRVEAIGQLDAFVYPTWRYYVHRYGPRLLNAGTWRNVLSGKTVIGPYVRSLRKRLKNQEPGDADAEPDQNLAIPPYAREFPPKEKVVAGLKRLVNRGVRFFNFFSNDYYMYRDQYVDCFRDIAFRDHLRLEFIPGADHLVSKLSDQNYLCWAITDWVRGLRRAPAVSSAIPTVPMTAALADRSL